jgi:hypothetical protein
MCLLSSAPPWSLSSNHIVFLPKTPFFISLFQALIWDISKQPRAIEDPILAFAADGEINQLQWCASHEDWVTICFGNYVQILKV